MSAIAQLKAMPEARAALREILGQFGWGALAIGGVRAAWRSRLKRQELPRQFLLALWEHWGDREAIVDGDRRVTFGQFRDRVLRLTNGLHRLGIGEGEAVAEVMHNGAPWFELMLACTLRDNPMPMLNWHLQPKELAECINKASPKALVLGGAFVEAVQSVRDQLTTVEHFIVVDADELPEGMIAYESLIRDSRSILPSGKLGMAPKTYSGGTTGTPKYINIDRDRLTSDSAEARRGASKEEVTRLGLMQISAFHFYKIGKIRDPISNNIRTLIPGPLYHAGVQIAVLPFFLGGTAVPMSKFDPELMLKLIQDERINWTFVAPTMLERILALPEALKSQYDLSSMRVIICAAAPCPPKVKREINALFRRQGASDDVFHEYYGASESGLISVLASEDYQENPKRYDSVGKLRAAECRIYDEETGTWTPPGKEGKVLVRSPMALALNYVGLSEEKMKENYIGVEGKLWYDDGLIGYVDEDGFLYLTSRIKEMIISGGVNLFPNEIETVIKQHPAVLDVAVVRAPDKDLGEVPAAVIELKEHQQATREEIIEHCKKEGLYGFKLPKIVDFGELPRNLAGKLPKKQLEEKYWEGVARHG